MLDLTEQQEQEMIRLAKAGDPEANYQMSLWALDQAIAEPDEERWNRLAAKCLVKAAEAGYEPAKEKMAELLEQTPEEPAAQPAAVPYTAPAAESAPRPEPAAPAAPSSAPAPAAPAAKNTVGDIAGKVKGFFAAAAAKVKGLFAKSGEPGAAAASDGKKPGFLNFSEWDDAKWKKMQRICVIICIVLVLLIIVLLITGRHNRKSAADDVLPTPVAEAVDTPAPTTTPEPVAYPSEAVKQEITAASLDVYPEDADYVTEAQTATVATSGSNLNMRRSPSQSGGLVGSIPNGTTTDVYAFKNGWALVKYDNTWGWCSKEYLK